LQEVPAILKCLQCPGMQSREWEMFIEARRGFALNSEGYICREQFCLPTGLDSPRLGNSHGGRGGGIGIKRKFKFRTQKLWKMFA
jgi:hypothetical protein